MHDIRPFLPELFDNPGSLVYIGARADAHSWLDELIEAGHQVIVVEIWPANIDSLADYLASGKIVQLLKGDVRAIVGLFDYIIWWHGPEHLPEQDIKPTLERLERMTRRTLALACPWGIYPQGTHEGNPNEEHKTTLYPDYFEQLGYSIKTDGQPDIAGSEIVAWKRFND